MICSGGRRFEYRPKSLIPVPKKNPNVWIWYIFATRVPWVPEAILRLSQAVEKLTVTISSSVVCVVTQNRSVPAAGIRVRPGVRLRPDFRLRRREERVRWHGWYGQDNVQEIGQGKSLKVAWSSGLKHWLVTRRFRVRVLCPLVTLV